LYLLEIKTVNQNNQQKKSNPLSQWFRQPKIFVKLPSNGDYYPNGALDKSATGEYAVYAMTAKDELMFKTPDALLSGQSTVEVIKSCIPAIQDPWQMPSLDIDAALIAIRVATYGENMGVEANCPHCGEENDYDIDLVHWLDQINSWKFVPEVDFTPLTIFVRPYTYRELSQTSLKTLEHQRIFNVINNEELSDEQKIEKFGQSFVKLTSLTVDIIAGCVSKISTPDGDVTDPAFIKEYIANAPKDVFEKISNHVTEMKQNIELPVQHVACNSCSKEFDMPVTMDQSNFFGVGS
jgi:hypothetical protein